MSSQIEQAKATAKRRDMADFQHRVDMFVNAYNGFGGIKDPMYRIRFSAGAVLTRAELEDLFRYNWVARRIVEVIPQDATRQWIDLKTEDQGIVTDLMGRMDTLEAQAKVEEAMTLARLYGGAVIVLGALDGQMPDVPLNEDRISELRFLNVLDRWQLEIEQTYSDPMQANFGQPEIYRIHPVSAGTIIRQNMRIHESRLLRFDGSYLPEIMRIGNAGWYDSIIISINEELKRHGVSVQSGAILMQDFITKALKLPDLTDKLGNAEGEQALLNRIQFAISNASSLGITLVGEGEEFTKIQTPIAGLVDLLNAYIELISAASGIPRARLFGQSLGVLAGATETTRTYYDMIKAYQSKHMRRQIEKLIRIMFKAKNSASKGREPKEWSFDFRPLWQLTDKEQADARKVVAEADQIYINTGVVTPDEVARNRFSADGYSMETMIDFALRAEFEKQLLAEHAKLLAAQKIQGQQGQQGQGLQGQGTQAGKENLGQEGANNQ